MSRPPGSRGTDVGRLQRGGSLRGVRLEDVSVPRPGQRFAFVMDSAPCAGAEEFADGVDLLVAESTFSADVALLAEQAGPAPAGPPSWLPTTLTGSPSPNGAASIRRNFSP